MTYDTDSKIDRFEQEEQEEIDRIENDKQSIIDEYNNEYGYYAKKYNVHTIKTVEDLQKVFDKIFQEEYDIDNLSTALKSVTHYDNSKFKNTDTFRAITWEASKKFNKLYHEER